MMISTPFLFGLTQGYASLVRIPVIYADAGNFLAAAALEAGPRSRMTRT